MFTEDKYYEFCIVQEGNDLYRSHKNCTYKLGKFLNKWIDIRKYLKKNQNHEYYVSSTYLESRPKYFIPISYKNMVDKDLNIGFDEIVLDFDFPPNNSIIFRKVNVFRRFGNDYNLQYNLYLTGSKGFQVRFNVKKDLLTNYENYKIFIRKLAILLENKYDLQADKSVVSDPIRLTRMPNSPRFIKALKNNEDISNEEEQSKSYLLARGTEIWDNEKLFNDIKNINLDERVSKRILQIEEEEENTINIIPYLRKLGIHNVNHFSNPFRNDNKPSCFVSKRKDSYFDMGERKFYVIKVINNDLSITVDDEVCHTF